MFLVGAVGCLDRRRLTGGVPGGVLGTLLFGSALCLRLFRLLLHSVQNPVKGRFGYRGRNVWPLACHYAGSRQFEYSEFEPEKVAYLIV